MRPGSFSSASTPFGGRPASGLSRRRGQFRGPPPSFYRSGGWGQYSDKRSEHASKASHSHEAQGTAQSGPAGGTAGTGPGGFTTGYGSDVPHFDNRAHQQTQNNIERSRHKARRKRDTRFDGVEEEASGGSTMTSFLWISGLLAGMFGLSGVLATRSKAAVRVKEENGSAAASSTA